VTSIGLRPQATLEAGRLFEQYADRVFAYCERRLGSRSDAEDAAQTTFLQVHRALARGVVPNTESAWLFTIARNVCRWQERTGLRRAPIAGDVDVDWLESPLMPETDSIDLGRDLEEALAGIPERQRQAFVLREWRGLTCDEIASKLDLSVEATNALLTRARRSVVSALVAAGRRPVLGLDLGSLFVQLRALLAGSSAKVAVGVVAVLVTGVAGVTVERALVHPPAERASAVPSTVQGSAGAALSVTRPRAAIASTGLERAVRAPGRHAGVGAGASANAPGTVPGAAGATSEPVSSATPPSGTAAGTVLPAAPVEKTPVPEPVEDARAELLPPLELPPPPELEVTVEVDSPDLSVPPVVPGMEVEVPDLSVTVSVPDTSEVVTGLLP
jgi:RNA polymerase sigma factor (sigma-70 family)